MQAKKWMTFALTLLASGLCLSAQGYPSAPAAPNPAPAPQQNQMMTTPRVDCTKLSVQEQDFANQLNPMNKALFCGKFDSDMRRLAMQNAGQMGSEGTLITNDQAVEQVAKANNMTMPMMPGSRQNGSCPAK